LGSPRIQLLAFFHPVHEPEPGRRVLAHQLLAHAIGYDLVGNLDAREAARLRVTRQRESRKTDARKGAHMRLSLVLFAALVGAIPAWAHHSFGATFDANKPVTITGVLTKVQWTNPHSHIYLDVKDKDGAVVAWTFEGYPSVVLYRTGWTRDETMKIGDTLTVFGWRARDNSPFALGREVTLPGGKPLYFGPPSGTGEGSPVAPGN
jgi:hypothetical protein